MLTAIRVFASGLLGSFRRQRFNAGSEEEFQSHLQMLADRFVSQGMTKGEALRAAKQQFGGVAQVEEELRERSRLAFLDSLWRDTRYALRQIRRSPAFTAVAVLTLALGIGANTAIFSEVNAVLLRPLPYAHPQQLVVVWEANPKQGYTDQKASPADFVDWSENTHVFTQMAAFINWSANLSEGDRAERVNATLVSTNLFGLLGVKPFLGRMFVPQDEQIVPYQSAILSYDLWKTSFGADRTLIGRTVRVNGRELTVVGVMPVGFHFPGELGAPADVWFPLARPASEWKIRDFHYLTVIGRMKPDMTLAQAQAEMSVLQRRIMKEYPNVGAGSEINLVPLHQAAVGKARTALLVLLGAVGFVLLIACANVANLLLARASSRSREFVLRIALGARRSRIVKQLLTESLVLSALGGGLGLLLAGLGLRAIFTLVPAGLPLLGAVRIDSWVLGFTVLISGATGLAFGLVPARKTSELDLNQQLKEGGWSTGGSIGRNRLHDVLLVAEVGLAMVLLVGAGLMIQSFARLQEVNPGFDPDHLLTFEMTLAGAQYPNGEQQEHFFHEALERIRALPGVIGAGATTALPLTGENDIYTVGIEGRPTASNQWLTADYAAVTPGYFRAFRIPLLAGRTFTEHDTGNAPPVAVINQAFAHRYFPNTDPIGKGIHVGNDRHPGYSQIVGVVGDIRQNSLNGVVNPTMYESYLQSPVQGMYVAVRTATRAMGVAAAVRDKVETVDSSVPVAKLRTMNQVLAGSIAQPRFRTVLLTLFALLAIALAAVGLYGVMSYVTAQRTHEIGVRMALGAQKADILGMVVGRGLKLTLIGVAIGIAGALSLTQFLSSLLYGVRPTDPLTFIAVSLIITGVALLASYVPARRATKVDPMVALRYE
jgi:putative ABC transport system permease protein